MHVRNEALQQLESIPMLAQDSEGDTIVVLARRSQVKDPSCVSGEPFSAQNRAARPPP
jgi:hypothetical protein